MINAEMLSIFGLWKVRTVSEACSAALIQTARGGFSRPCGMPALSATVETGLPSIPEIMERHLNTGGS